MTRYERTQQARLAPGPVNTTGQTGGALVLAPLAPARSQTLPDARRAEDEDRVMPSCIVAALSHEVS